MKPVHTTLAINLQPQRGSVSVLFTLLLPVLLGFGAFAVDFPYLMTIRTEMQTAADAAALAGARYLGEGGVANWDAAIAQTQAALAKNSVGGKAITQATIETGYWDTSSNRVGLQSLPMTPALTDVPAIKVSISRSNGKNSGEVSTIFANFLGIKSLPISATAVAARPGPSTVGTNVLFPMAMSQCVFNLYWNASTNPPGPKVDSKGNPIMFKLGDKNDPGCGSKTLSGEWAVPLGNSTNDPYLRGLVTTRITQSLAVGDQLNVTPGNHSNQLYDAVNNCSAAAPLSQQTCRYVTMPVVSNTVKSGNNTIYGFACIEILSAAGSSSKFVTVTMSTKCQTPPSSGIGPSYGVITPPKLFM
jgi:Flp pilus assembly protein TadG